MAVPGFFVHGVNTIIEYPERAASIRHAGWGTRIEQNADPSNRKNNWFHLPFPSPALFKTEPNVSEVLLRWIILRAEVNENAKIAEIHIRDDNRLLHSCEPGWIGQEIDDVIPGKYGVVDWEIKGALVLCMRVEFLTGSPRGVVIIRSAGATIRR